MNKLISELCNLVIGLLGKEVIGKESNVEIKILEIVQPIVIPNGVRNLVINQI